MRQLELVGQRRVAVVIGDIHDPPLFRRPADGQAVGPQFQHPRQDAAGEREGDVAVGQGAGVEPLGRAEDFVETAAHERGEVAQGEGHGPAEIELHTLRAFVDDGLVLVGRVGREAVLRFLDAGHQRADPGHDVEAYGQIAVAPEQGFHAARVALRTVAEAAAQAVRIVIRGAGGGIALVGLPRGAGGVRRRGRPDLRAARGAGLERQDEQGREYQAEGSGKADVHSEFSFLRMVSGFGWSSSRARSHPVRASFLSPWALAMSP